MNDILRNGDSRYTSGCGYRFRHINVTAAYATRAISRLAVSQNHHAVTGKSVNQPTNQSTHNTRGHCNCVQKEA